MFSNLIGNAIKFTKQGRIDIHLELIKESREQQLIRFKIIDTGIGIKQTDLESIFEPFIQADSLTTRQYGGTGLGLALVTQLVKLMQGIVKVQSEEGVGSTFLVELPFKILCKQKETDDLQQLDDNVIERVSKPLKVLLVEDESTNQKVIAEILRRMAVTVEIAENGKVALIKTLSTRFDLIFMDILMPEMDGFQTTRAIRQDKNNVNQETPIIALTARVGKSDQEECLAAGMNDFLGKPINIEFLKQNLQKYSFASEGGL